MAHSLLAPTMRMSIDSMIAFVPGVQILIKMTELEQPTNKGVNYYITKQHTLTSMYNIVLDS